MTLIDAHKENFSAAIEHLKKETTTIRTGRATPALVEDIPVLAYGATQPLKAVASISIADARTLIVDPWDKSVVIAVEEAIRNSDVGINPVNDGKVIRLPLPELTTERRQDMVKLLHRKLEEARIGLRKVREEVRKEIDRAEQAKEISEDEKFNLQDELDALIKQYNDEVKQIGVEKEAEILKV